MDNLKMCTPDLTERNFTALAALFPNAVTGTVDENGVVVRAIDKDVPAQEINARVVEGREECYQFAWPDKRKSILLANAPITAALRPCTCFKWVNTALITEIAKQKPYYAVFRDSSFTYDSAMVCFEQVFTAYSPNTIRRETVMDKKKMS
jgi:hypothetical protein